MAQAGKTPVMVLQELMQKKGAAPPVYEIIPELTKQGTHINEFYYRVTAHDYTAFGKGSSKQIAKHDAAKAMLNNLQEVGLYHPADNPVQGFVPGSTVLSNKPIKTSVNCILTLYELCEENKIPQPIFKEISDVGPPHCREFTYDCMVASVRTRATASTKKQAKQIAAQEMLEKIKDVLPQLAEECNPSSKQITNQDAETINKYCEVSTHLTKRLDLSCRIRDYDHVFKKLIIEKELDFRGFKDINDSEEFLERVVEKLGLTKRTVVIQENPVIVAFSLSTDVPFCVLGRGRSKENAVKSACEEASSIIKNWME